MEATYFGNFHLNTLWFRHPYVGIIQIRLMGRRSYLPLSLSAFIDASSSPLFNCTTIIHLFQKKYKYFLWIPSNTFTDFLFIHGQNFSKPFYLEENQRAAGPPLRSGSEYRKPGSLPIYILTNGRLYAKLFAKNLFSQNKIYPQIHLGYDYSEGNHIW